MGRLSTGLAGLDAQLGGGVPQGTVHVLLAEPMNALELFALHFAIGDQDGTLFVTSESSVEEVKAGVKMIGGRPERIKVQAFDAKTKSLPTVPKGARYILDSFSTRVVHLGFETAFEELVRLKQEARKNGSTVLVTAISGLHDVREQARLRLWADGALELGFDRQGFGLYPFLKVTKMRGVPDSARFLLFKETPKGLFMESTRRVF